MRILFKRDRTMSEEFTDFCIIACIVVTSLTIISNYFIGISLSFIGFVIGIGIMMFGYFYSQGLTLRDFLGLPHHNNKITERSSD